METLANKRKVKFDNFRKNIRIVRCFKGFSGAELSELIGAKSKKRINDIEEGRISQPDVMELFDIAEALGATVDDLMYKEAEIIFKPIAQ